MFICVTGNLLMRAVIYTEKPVHPKQWIDSAFPSSLCCTFLECGNQLWNKHAKCLFAGFEQVLISVLLHSWDWAVCGRKKVNTNLLLLGGPEAACTPHLTAVLGFCFPNRPSAFWIHILKPKATLRLQAKRERKSSPTLVLDRLRWREEH